MAETVTLRPPISTGAAAEEVSQCAGYRWRHVREAEGLLADGLGDPALLMRCPGAVCVKQHGRRQVWRVSRSEGTYFVKVYAPPLWRERLKWLLRRPPWEQEWHVSRYAEAQGIPAVRVLGYAVPATGVSGPAAVLVSEAVPGARPLDECWKELAGLAGADGRRRRLALIDALACAIARAHQRGFEHRDLHARNVLVAAGAKADRGCGDPAGPAEMEAGPAWRIVLVDLHAVRCGRPVSLGAVVRNLAQLNQWFSRHATRAERLRFVRHYLYWRERFAEGPLARRLDLSARGLVVRALPVIRSHAERLWAKRDRQALRDGKYYHRLRVAGGWRGAVVLQPRRAPYASPINDLRFNATQWQQWLADPAAFWRRHERGRTIKDSHSGQVIRARLVTEEGATLEVVAKRSRPRNWLRAIVFAVRPSRERRAWRRGYALIHRDLPSPRPLAFLERRRWGLLAESLLIVEAIPDARDLYDAIWLDWTGLSPRALRRCKDGAIEALVRLVCDFQHKGFSHRDFKASNLLVRQDPATGACQLWLVDLDGLQRCRRLSERRRWSPLVRLNVSLIDHPVITRTDRLRVLRRYLQASGRDLRQWKALWRHLAGWSAARAEQKRRRTEWKLRHYGRP